MKGPVPTGWIESSPSLSFGTMRSCRSAKMSAKPAYAMLRSNFTVCASTIETLSTIDRLVRAREPVAGSRMRFIVATTSSASSTRP
jgi:hypothetical protein